MLRAARIPDESVDLMASLYPHRVMTAKSKYFSRPHAVCRIAGPRDVVQVVKCGATSTMLTCMSW